MLGDLFDKAVDAVTQPFDDGVSIVKGLTEGELRTAAAARLGTDVVAGMAISEVVEYLQDADVI